MCVPFCEANLTGYKRPKIVEFRTDLPKTPVGKVLRRELRDKGLNPVLTPTPSRPKPAVPRSRRVRCR